jgi:hypothetical protein
MTRSTLIALAVFVSLGVVYAATRERQVSVGIRKLKAPEQKADDFTSLRVGALSLTKEGDGWKVSRDGKTYAADPNEVRPFTQALAGLKSDDFVTDKPEKHAELEVDEAKGLVIEAGSRKLVLGKASKSGGAYVREAGSKDVYVATGSLPWLARRELAQWRQKRLELGKAEDVEKVTLTPSSGDPVVLVRSGADFTLEGTPEPGYRFDAAAAARVVTQLTTLAATNFLEEPVTPAFTVLLSMKGGAARTLRFGAKRADGTYAVTIDGDPQTYVLSAWVAEQVLKDREGLRNLQLLSVAPADVERVVLTSGGGRVVLEKKSDAWTVVEPKTLPPGFDFDASQVERQLFELVGLRGTKVARERSVTKPAASLELVTKTGAKHQLVVGAKLESGEVPVRGQDPFTVLAPVNVLTSLERGLELFKRPPPPQGLEQLPPELRAQLEAQLRQQR